MQPPCQLSLITTLSDFIHFYGFRVKHHWIDAVFSPCIWRISPACGENYHVVRRTRKAGKFRATPSLRGPVRPDGRLRLHIIQIVPQAVQDPPGGGGPGPGQVGTDF